MVSGLVLHFVHRCVYPLHDELFQSVLLPKERNLWWTTFTKTLNPDSFFDGPSIGSDVSHQVLS